MGVFKMFSSSMYDSNSSDYECNNNPNPRNFSILRESEIKRGRIALLVHYPDATNFEGKKIIILSTEDYNLVKSTNILDPHFSDTGQTVIARFAPTENGWSDALKFLGL